MTVRQRQSVSSRFKEMVKGSPTPIKISESEIVVPTDHQARLNNTAVTHTSAIVAPSTANSQTTWQPVPEGMSEFVNNLVSDLNVGSVSINLYWSEDGSNNSGKTIGTLSSDTSAIKSSKQWFPVCGNFYKTEIWNGHTAPITGSANIKFRP